VSTQPSVVGVKWKAEPAEHNYPAAADYLALVLPEKQVKKLVAALRNTPQVQKKAKDLERASGLPMLSENNPHVAADLVKVKAGDPLSPILLVRGRWLEGCPLLVADGYHRICASHHLDENGEIPCRIVDA
jgi:hypothetical protein